MKNPATKKIVDMTHDNFDRKRFKVIRNGYTWVSFNGIAYDELILSAYLLGYSTVKLKALSDEIISGQQPSWAIANDHGIGRGCLVDHIDLREVAPAAGGLKIRGARQGSTLLRELPIEHGAVLTDEEKEEIRIYCHNDLKVTEELFYNLSDELDARVALSSRYGMDCRSKSDAQIGEGVVVRDAAFAADVPTYMLPKPNQVNMAFKYVPPNYLQFRTELMQQVFDDCKTTTFKVPCGSKVVIPRELKKYSPKIKAARIKKLLAAGKIAEVRAYGIMDENDLRPLIIGNTAYTLQIGGIHSTEKCASHYSNDEYSLYDYDVESYYPKLILNSGLFPQAIGKPFIRIYHQLVDSRVKAKIDGDATANSTLKIIINGIFGKLGSWYSRLFAPELLVYTCITGQLSLLMLIETLEINNIAVVSANTDGIVIKPKKSQIKTMERICDEWQNRTNLKLDRNEYKSLHSESVNSYFAIKNNGEVKVKGIHAPPSLAKNPQGYVCSLAVQNYLSKGTSLHETIFAEKDIKNFLHVRTVNGGCLDEKDNYCGRIVRWYYTTNENAQLRYKVNGHKVPGANCAASLANLPDSIPNDLDYRHYVNNAIKILKRCGVDYVS